MVTELSEEFNKIVAVKSELINSETLKDEFRIAANVTKTDDLINSGDLFRLRQHLIGSSLIEQ